MLIVSQVSNTMDSFFNHKQFYMPDIPLALTRYAKEIQAIADKLGPKRLISSETPPRKFFKAINSRVRPSPSEHRILNFLIEVSEKGEFYLSKSEIARYLDIHFETVKKSLYRLRKKGLIKCEDYYSGRYTGSSKYSVTKEGYGVKPIVNLQQKSLKLGLAPLDDRVQVYLDAKISSVSEKKDAPSPTELLVLKFLKEAESESSDPFYFQKPQLAAHLKVKAGGLKTALVRLKAKGMIAANGVIVGGGVVGCTSYSLTDKGRQFV